MDFRAEPHPIRRTRPSRAVRVPDVAPGAPPRGQGRRLPVPPADERESRRASRRRRRTIAEVAAVIETPRPSPGRDPSRWARFEAMVTAAGIDRGRLLDAFPCVEDIEDVFHTPDDDLVACAGTLVRALREADREASPPPPVVAAPAVRCADCRHFLRSATHPRLGRCGAGERAGAAGGWWDTQPRACTSFAVVAVAAPSGRSV